MNQAVQAQTPHLLYENDNVGEEEIRVFSEVDARTGMSMTIYKGQDFNEEEPVYHVKIWDEEGGITKRKVDIAKIDSKNCDEVDMLTFSAHLSISGQYLQAYFKFASAKVYAQKKQAACYPDIFQNTDWRAIVRDFMQIQYDAGNVKGYLEYKKFLAFLE